MPATEGVTFMMTDVEGSTALWEADPARASAAIARQEEIIRQCVEQYGGECVKSRGEGDSAFCTFKSCAETLLAAQAIQQAIAAEPWNLDSPLKLRIAIHCGPVEFRDNDYFGAVLSRCARLRSAGHGGQILLSEAVRSQAPEGMKFRDHGRHRLRDLLSAEHVFELTYRDLQFPPLRTLNGLDHNLPVQLTTFIGREKNLADLEAALSASRLVTLTGFGGAGKTRLGLQAAANRLAASELSVRFVALSDLPRGTEVLTPIAKALGVSLQQSGDPMSKLVEEIDGKNMLLFLDNCEHVLDSACLCARTLIEACPQLRVLATSREPLGLTGERCLNIEPLRLPRADDENPVSVLKSESAALFVDRVRLHNQGFALDAASTPLVVQLVRAVDGIPLAIEQAAARVASLGLIEVVHRLGHILELLKSGARDLEPRQRTLRATIEWSHSLLEPEEKELFAALGAFQGIFTLADASAVAGRDACDPLESLTNKSMLSPVYVSSNETHFRLLDTLKEFARERIPEDAPACFSNHLGWCLKTARWIDSNIEGLESSNAFNLLDRVYEDLIVGLRRAIDAGDRQGLELAFEMRKPWLRRGPTMEGVRLLQEALETVPNEGGTLVADCHNALGAMAMSSGLEELALKHLDEAALRFANAGMVGKVAVASVNRAILLAKKGDFKNARPQFEVAIESFDLAGDPLNSAKASLNLGRMLLDAGESAQAVPHLDKALRHFEESDPVREALTLVNLAEADPSNGDLVLRRLERAFRILEDSPDHSQMAIALTRLSCYAVRIGSKREAVLLLGAAEQSLSALTASSSIHLMEEWGHIRNAVEDLPRADYDRAFAKGRALEENALIQMARKLCVDWRSAQEGAVENKNE